VSDKPSLIVIDGIEGAGKTSVIEYVKSKIGTAQIEFTKDPGGSHACQGIRNLLVQETYNYSNEALLLLYWASRVQLNNDVIIPAFENNKHVLSDRYVSTTYSYQGYADNLIFTVRIMDRMFFNIKPIDYFIFLDVDPAIGLTRSFAKAKATQTSELRFENRGLDFFNSARDGFYKYMENDLSINPSRQLICNTNEDNCTAAVGDQIITFLRNHNLIQ